MYRKQLFIAALSIFGATAAMAEVQDVYWEIGKSANVKVPREPGEYRIVVVGRVKGAIYQGEVKLESIPISPLPQPGDVQAPNTQPPPKPSIANNRCQPYIDKVDGLLGDAGTKYNSPDLTKPNPEEEFWNAVVALRTAIEHPIPGCSPDPAVNLSLAQLIEQSSWVLGTYPLKRGQLLTATVKRTISASKTEDFVYQITTGARGNWMASFAFGITPNNDEHFYSKAADDGTFVLTKKRDNGGVIPTAAAFYTWLPKDRELSNWNHGLAVGVGVDQSNLALFLGYHLTFNQNVGLVLGAALHQETRLRGEYENEQSLTENLTSDSLEEKVLKPTWFLAVTMRFASKEK